MNKLNVKKAIMYNLYMDFNSAFFIYDTQKILEKHDVNSNIYCLMKAVSDIRKKYNIDIRNYLMRCVNDKKYA